jgi:hypothetical protein
MVNIFQIVVLWVSTPYVGTIVSGYQCFAGTHCLHLRVEVNVVAVQSGCKESGHSDPWEGERKCNLVWANRSGEQEM